MTPKERAKELVNKYSSILPYYNQKDNLNKSKRCALIAVDEILNNNNHFMQTYAQNDYWLKVKQEIEKLTD